MSKQHEQALLFLRKAECDEVLLDEILTSERVADDIIGFHCQQAAEKLLKSLLSELGIPFPRTHNLRLLMDLLDDAGHHLPVCLVDLDVLTPFGVLFRYEDAPAEIRLDRTTARRMVGDLGDHVRKLVR